MWRELLPRRERRESRFEEKRKKRFEGEPSRAFSQLGKRKGKPLFLQRGGRAVSERGQMGPLWKNHQGKEEALLEKELFLR